MVMVMVEAIRNSCWNFVWTHNKHKSRKRMTRPGSSSSSAASDVHQIIFGLTATTATTMTLLIALSSMTDGAALISSSYSYSNSHHHPHPLLLNTNRTMTTVAHNFNSNSNSNPVTSPSVLLKLSSESGRVDQKQNTDADEPSGDEDEDEGAYEEDDDYYYDSFPSYSEEDLENVADSDDLHSKYFVRTRPRLSLSQSQNQKSEPEAESEPTKTTSQRSIVFEMPEARGGFLSENQNQSPKFFDISESDEESGEAERPSEAHVKSAETLIPSPSSHNSIATDDTGTTTDSSTSIPGTPGIDYPIFGEVPYTGFDCQKQRYKGFFADLDTKCQAWHYCDFTDGHSTFLCPNGTLFSQVLLTCDWWFNVNCSEAQQLYVLNERLYRYIKTPKPSFPEDYHGPQVDLWLLQQLQLGLLPKKSKIVIDKMVVSGNNRK